MRYAKALRKAHLENLISNAKAKKSSKASKTVKVSGTERFLDRKIQKAKHSS